MPGVYQPRYDTTEVVPVQTFFLQGGLFVTYGRKAIAGPAGSQWTPSLLIWEWLGWVSFLPLLELENIIVRNSVIYPTEEKYLHGVMIVLCKCLVHRQFPQI
jgi:hypothetical protein